MRGGRVDRFYFFRCRRHRDDLFEDEGDCAICGEQLRPFVCHEPLPTRRAGTLVAVPERLAWSLRVAMIHVDLAKIALRARLGP